MLCRVVYVYKTFCNIKPINNLYFCNYSNLSIKRQQQKNPNLELKKLFLPDNQLKNSSQFLHSQIFLNIKPENEGPYTYWITVDLPTLAARKVRQHWAQADFGMPGFKTFT